MSENNYEPGKGMHHEDLNALTEYWHRETNYINDNVDSSFKSAQNDAYARGYRRGRDDLIMVRKQRDELLAALNRVEQVALALDAYFSYERGLDVYIEELNAIARVKGNAA